MDRDRRTRTAARRSCSSPASRADGSGCARPSTRWPRTFRVHHVLARRRAGDPAGASTAAAGFDGLRRPGRRACSTARGTRRGGASAACRSAGSSRCASRRTRPERDAGAGPGLDAGPGWHLTPRHEVYARLPWLFGPVFLAEMPWRMRRPGARGGASRSPRTAGGSRRAQLRTFLEAPLSLSRMAARARLIAATDDAGARAAARVACPTLVVTGEPRLDHVVAAEGTSRVRRR